ncbi:hypothetical protein [Photobacterium kasasachensis]|uniref:hypothetical protein n=1 Tax=Photobacterium TaxID=657 RepID=UPI003D0F7470
MKVMKIGWADVCGYGDWLTPQAALKFVQGGYTHVEFQGETIPSELSYSDDGEPMVGLGKQEET